MRKNPIYQFKTELSLGIGETPNETMILIEDYLGGGIRQVFKIGHGALIGGSSIADFMNDPTLWIEPMVIPGAEQGGVAWDATVAYRIGDMVVELGVPYIALATSLNSTPPSLEWASVAGAPQVQANWLEANIAAPAYINNKPLVVDNLTTNSTTDVLSAQQGFTLNAATNNIINGTSTLTDTTMIGDPTAPTAPPGDNDFSVANTAFVTAATSFYIPLAEKGAINGVATLGPDQKVPASQLPPMAINHLYPVADEAEMFLIATGPALAHGGLFVGDMAVLATGHNYVALDTVGGDITAWLEISSPAAAPVQSDWLVVNPADLAYIVSKPTIVDDLITGGTTDILSAQQGVVLNAGITNIVNGTTDLTDTTLIGSPTTPTAAPGTNDTSVASTAFVTAALSAVGGTVPLVEDFIAAPGQRDYVVANRLFTKAYVYVNGVKIRDVGTIYTLSDDGTNTTLNIANPAVLNQWVSIEFEG